MTQEVQCSPFSAPCDATGRDWPVSKIVSCLVLLVEIPAGQRELGAGFEPFDVHVFQLQLES